MNGKNETSQSHSETGKFRIYSRNIDSFHAMTTKATIRID